jgi:pyruvate/2-oxoglutarate/acetoin dehydrogenase E1 component
MSSPSEAMIASVLTREMTYREAICAALADELESDSSVVLLGEDIAEAGGPFKTTEGLLARFGPNRVIDTPICENGFIGVALGMALTGMRPVVEVMFGEFLATAGDAMMVELPKHRFMSGGQVAVPVTIRAIGGATNRFGAQHSATAESWFLQASGLKVVTASGPNSAYSLLRASVRDLNPVLFIEHKAMYARKGAVSRSSTNIAEVGRAAVIRPGSDVTIVATLLMVERALAAAEELARDGIDAEVIDLRWLAPLDFGTLRESLARTKRLVVVAEESFAASWCATLLAQFAIEGVAFKAAPKAVTLLDLPVPFSPPLEDATVPSTQRVASAVREMFKKAHT